MANLRVTMCPPHFKSHTQFSRPIVSPSRATIFFIHPPQRDNNLGMGQVSIRPLENLPRVAAYFPTPLHTCSLLVILYLYTVCSTPPRLAVVDLFIKKVFHSPAKSVTIVYTHSLKSKTKEPPAREEDDEEAFNFVLRCNTRETVSRSVRSPRRHEDRDGLSLFRVVVK